MKPAMLLVALPLALSLLSPATLHAREPKRFAIAVHGGAGSAPSKDDAAANVAKHDWLKRALEAGQRILADGGRSVDAVENAVRILEDDPVFNAGKGAALNARGEAELDSSRSTAMGGS